MNVALVVLLRLRWKARIRWAVRGLRTPRGAIFSLFGLAVVISWLGPSLWLAGRRRHVDPDLVRTVASSMTLLMCLLSFLPSGGRGQGAAYFTPAEISFLFAGPFTRRALLAYKLACSAAGLTLTSILIMVFVFAFVPWWVSAYVGILLDLFFIQLFGMAVALVAQTIAERARTRARRFVVLAMCALLAVGLWRVLASAGSRDFATLLREFRLSAPGYYVLAPFDLFGEAIAAQTLQALVLWGSLALAVDVALLRLVFWLDVSWEEAAVLASQRAYERLEQMRRGGVWGVAFRGPMRWSPPRLPRLDGVGPLAWRQLTNVIRHPWSLVAPMVFIVFILVPGLLSGGPATLDAVVVLLISLVFSMWLQCDFRSDMDHIPWIKMLPLRPVAVAAGQLAVAALLTTIVQLALLGALAARPTARWDVLVLAAICTLPLNVLLFGTQNLVFLILPVRMVPATVPDLQHFGRMMVIFMLQSILLLLCGGAAALVGLIVYWWGGGSLTVAVAGSWVALVIEAGATIAAVAWAYRRFDVSLHTPPS